MVTITNETDSSIDTARLQQIAERLTERDVDLLLCGDDTIRNLNREHRGIDRSTDVLSFPLSAEALPQMPLGSIVISLDRVREAAAGFGHSEEEELSLLFIHGLLHLLGYDHEKDHGEMREREEELIRSFGLPESLIVRTEG